jgi:hypothetical protein
VQQRGEIMLVLFPGNRQLDYRLIYRKADHRNRGKDDCHRPCRERVRSPATEFAKL